MDRNLSFIKERILYLTDYHKDKKEDFFKKIGVTYGNFKGIQKETSVSSDTIEKILSIYPDVDAVWLLTGKGEIFKKNSLPGSEKTINEDKLPSYLDLDINLKLIEDLNNVNDAYGEFFKEIRTANLFSFVLNSILQNYFSGFENVKENKSKFLSQNTFDYKGYRRSVALELMRVIKFKPAFHELEKAIHRFYDEIGKHDTHEIITDAYYSISKSKETIK